MKKIFLGSTRKIPPHLLAGKNFENKIQARVNKPLEWDKAVTHCACIQCGTVKEIDREYAARLLELSKKSVTLIEEIRRYYFTVSYCEYCRERPVKVTMTARTKKIST